MVFFVLLNLSCLFILSICKIAHATVRRLSDVKGISEAKVTKLKDIVKQMVSMDFQTAADALEARKSILCLTTGSVEIDKLLEGGIETGSITEVVSNSLFYFFSLVYYPLFITFLTTTTFALPSPPSLILTQPYQRPVRRIPHGQDTTMPHAVRDMPNALWRRGC